MEVRSIEKLIGALNESGVQYLIVGGLAVNAHGFVRLTRDVDIVLRLQPENTVRGLEAMLKAGWKLAVPVTPADFACAATRERWRVEKNMIVLKLWSDEHRRTPVDVFIYEPFDFPSEWDRRLNVEVAPGISAPVVSLESLLRMKAAAGRPQDLTDIAELKRLS